jgi:hypothetical protein
VLARYGKGAQARKTASARTTTTAVAAAAPGRARQTTTARPAGRKTPRWASTIRFLPWQPARRNRKLLPHAKGLARTMSAPRLPGTSGLGASKSATGSSTPRSRRARSNARRSDGTIKGTPAGPSRPAGVRRCAAKSSCCQTEIALDLLLWPCHASPGRCLLWSL